MNSDRITQIVRRAGFRATKQRTSLMSLLVRAKEPVSVQEISKDLKDSMDSVTVYRMIDAFKRANIVREVNFRDAERRYELADERDHHHIVCTDCGRVEDFTDETHGRVEQRVLARSKSFKKITGHSFDLYGLCKTCAK